MSAILIAASVLSLLADPVLDKGDETSSWSAVFNDVFDADAAADDGYDYLLRALNAPGVGFSLVNTWGGSTVPPTPAGVECFKRYLADPRILTVRDGVDLVK